MLPAIFSSTYDQSLWLFKLRRAELGRDGTDRNRFASGRCCPHEFNYELVLPLTNDRQAIEAAARNILPRPLPFNSVSGGIRRAAEYLQEEGRSYARKHTVVVAHTMNTPEVPFQRIIAP